MPTFRYRALSQVGEVVSGSIAAPSAAEVGRRIEYLGLIPIDQVTEESVAGVKRANEFAIFSRPRPEDVTIFTGDLALLLRTGARINDALELLAADSDLGRMRATTAKVAAAILSGESFADAIEAHPSVFPPIYVALARVGEASGNLAPILEAVCAERQRAEALRRRLSETLRYPAFLLIGAGGVLLFFLLVVLPQFSNVFKDFNAKLDPVLVTFLGISDFLRDNMDAVAGGVVCLLSIGFLLSRREAVRAAAKEALERLPLVSPVLGYRRTALFCRNLGLLLASGVTLPASLRVLADMMAAPGEASIWSQLVDKVRQGGKLSEALAQTRALPAMAVRTLRLGEDSGQLPMLAGRIADFYDAKLQRSLDRLVGFVGPASIIVISLIVGGLIVSVMTALLSVNQMAQ
ncbi:MAG TPA: type II secretion system F family protein [Roseiarcus sp.]|nr:type II secretion system F family protein [Roseiarcus sp.]